MSFVDELKAIREHVLAHATKTVAVPGSQGKLAVRFKPPDDRDRLTAVVAAFATRGALSREEELQLLVDCADQVLMRNGTGELEELDPPLFFDGSDDRWQADTAREAVAELFNLDAQPLAAAGTAESVLDWLQGVENDAARRVEGESEGGAE